MTDNSCFGLIVGFCCYSLVKKVFYTLVNGSIMDAMGWIGLGTSLCSDRYVALVRERFQRITDSNIPKNDALYQMWFEEHVI